MDIILPIAAIIALSLFFSKQFKLSPAASPLFAIALITVFLCLMGMINLLVAGVYVIYTAAVLGLVYVFFVKRYSFFEVMQEYLSVGVIFFIVGVVFFYFLLKSKNAIFRDWDEFSFWGVAAKTVFYYDKLYTFVPVSSPLAYPPALPVFSYFIQFFSRKFIEYRTYVAYDIMIVAALAPMFSRVRFENAITTISLTAFSFTGIYAFFHASEGLRAYATSYADMQIGFLFAGSLLMWYSDNKPKGVRYIGSLLVLMVLTLCKDMGLAVAFVAAAVMVVDMLISRTFPSDSLATRNEFFRRYAAVLLLAVISVPLFLLVGVIWGVAALILAVIVFFTIFYMKKLTKLVEQQGPVILRVVSILLLFIGIILIYRVWGIHYQTLKSVSRDAVYVYSIKDVLSGQNVVFNLVYEEMMFRFFNHSIICFGTIAEMLVVFTLIPIVISLFSWNASKILRVSALSILLSLGFIAYYLFHAYLFTTQFPNTYFYENTGAVELMSFNRYISSYAIGHMFAIGGILFLEVAKPFFKTKMLTFTFALVVSISLILSIFYYTPEHYDQYLLTSEKVIVSLCGPRSVIRKHISRLHSEFTVEDKIFFVSFATDDGEWFCLLYEAFPALLDEHLIDFYKPTKSTGKHKKDGMGSKEFSDYLIEHDITLVYVNYRMDDYFLEEFGYLFEDNLMYTFDDSARIYYVVKETGEEVRLVPVFNRDHLKELKGTT